jgi:uncharacterized repeat protein (TIGR01451 family)
MKQLHESDRIVIQKNQLDRQIPKVISKKTFKRSLLSLLFGLPCHPQTLPSKLGLVASILQFCSIVSINVFVLDLLSPSAVHAACSTSGLTVTRISAPKFYVDFGATLPLRGQYVGYKITNTGSTYADLWAKLQNFTGGVVSLAPNEDGIVHIGPLGIGQTTTVYFYLTANQTTEITQSHNLSIYNSNPSIGTPSSFCADNFSFLGAKGNPSVLDTIKASPNIVETVTTSPNPPEIGGKLVMTVTGNTGAIGSNRIFSTSAASLPGWPANVLELTSSKIEFLGPGNTGTFNDRLYLEGVIDIPDTQETNYRVTYTFKIQGTATAPISVNPLNNISSGNPVKHTSTDTAAYTALQPIQPPKLNLTVGSKTVSPTNLTTGGTATYTVIFNNTQGTVDAALDEIIDTLPSSPGNASYVANSAKFNGVSIPTGNISISGQTLTFSGLYTVPAGGTSTLTYQATIPGTNGTYVNSVIGKLGSVQVDTTTNTTDNAPAKATVSVGPLIPPVIDLDGDNSSGATNNDFNTSYTLGGSAIKIVDANNSTETLDTVITDTDSTQLSKAVITLTNNPAIVGDALSINATALSAIAAGAITADTSVANQITLNGNASLADYEAALELIEFSTTATNTTARTVTVKVTDTSAQVSNTATTNISIQVPPVIALDYGDAPDTNIGTGTGNYQTKANDGGAAQVMINAVGQVLSLGSNIDTDDGSLQNATAQADDTSGTPDDEDGVSSFPTLTTTANQTYTVPVTVQNNVPLLNAFLVGYIDFNKDGDFNDTGEKSATVTVPTSNTNPRTFNVVFTTPAGMTTGNTYARFRLGQVQATVESATGASAGTDNGEIEDYQIAIESVLSPPPLPASSCEVMMTNGSFESPALTTTPPTPFEVFETGKIAAYNETDVPGWLSFADSYIELWRTNNFLGVPAYEGEQFAEINAYVNGSLYQDVATTPGSVMTWQFAHRGRAGVDTMNLKMGSPGATVAQINPTNGTTSFQTGNAAWVVYQGTYAVPAGQTTTRFEYQAVATATGDQGVGNFIDAVRFGSLCDYGDAKSDYPVLRSNNGAAHINDGVTFLGSKVRIELDGQPSTAADGDDGIVGDVDQIDDEDGVTFSSTLNTGRTSSVDVVASVPGYLNAWIDFNQNNNWNDPGEKVFTDISLNIGTNNLSFTIPANANIGNTFARFRFSTNTGINSTGIVATGEVEDYQIAIAQPVASDPNLLLVKRITAINPGQADETQFNNFINDGPSTDDEAPNWPDSDSNPGNNINTYLRGAINVPGVKPGDEVEYTIYFLSDGDVAAKNIQICDVVPDNMTFNKNSYGTEVGIGLALNATTLPTIPNTNLSNLIDTDQGSFYAPGTNPPVVDLCKKHDPNPPNNLIPVDSSNNLSGAVLIQLNTPLPPATAPGTPPNSYGFVRFRAKVK